MDGLFNVLAGEFGLAPSWGSRRPSTGDNSVFDSPQGLVSREMIGDVVLEPLLVKSTGEAEEDVKGGRSAVLPEGLSLVRYASLRDRFLCEVSSPVVFSM